MRMTALAKKRSKKTSTRKQASLPGMENVKPAVKKRNTLKGRKVRREITARTAAEALGEIDHGCEIYCLTMGKFSLVDVIELCLKSTGPADVTVSTWTAASADIGFANRLMVDGAIKSLRFIVDYSFPSRQPAYCAALRERFGDDAIRITKNHAKFVLIRNRKWNLVIRTSMNLNECTRLETVEISDDKSMAKWMQEVVDDLFEKQSDTFDRKPSEHCTKFGEEWGDDEAGGIAGTDTRFFGDGANDVDLRRIGTTRRS